MKVLKVVGTSIMGVIIGTWVLGALLVLLAEMFNYSRLAVYFVKAVVNLFR